MFKWLKKDCWEAVDLNLYRQAYDKFGGSFVTHPDILIYIEHLLEIDTCYFAQYEHDKLIGAIATWGPFLAGDRRAIKKNKVNDMIDLGNPILVLPLDANASFKIHYKATQISHIHAAHIKGLKLNTKRRMTFVKSYGEKGFSSKHKAQLRKKHQVFTKSGGEARDIQTFPPDEIAKIYRVLHEKRWNKLPMANAYLERNLEIFHRFLFGKVLLINQHPVAIQINMMTDVNGAIYIDYINGGVDPDYHHLSAGTVLHYLNTYAAYLLASEENKALYYSFGVNDADYKLRWCLTEGLYCR